MINILTKKMSGKMMKIMVMTIRTEKVILKRKTSKKSLESYG
jgi:hypothetical protein